MSSRESDITSSRMQLAAASSLAHEPRALFEWSQGQLAMEALQPPERQGSVILFLLAAASLSSSKRIPLVTRCDVITVIAAVIQPSSTTKTSRSSVPRQDGFGYSRGQGHGPRPWYVASPVPLLASWMVQCGGMLTNVYRRHDPVFRRP
jgi:hypothetical protein